MGQSAIPPPKLKNHLSFGGKTALCEDVSGFSLRVCILPAFAFCLLQYRLSPTLHLDTNVCARAKMALLNCSPDRKQGAAVDVSDALQDDVLVGELAHTSDEKMKSIISTIQREQNAIIRNESVQTLLIQGVAGSGTGILPRVFACLQVDTFAFVLLHDRSLV
ncbi:MAG: hypothetical protein ACI36T_01055 [Eggerthellaceae bacterium]